MYVFVYVLCMNYVYIILMNVCVHVSVIFVCENKIKTTIIFNFINKNVIKTKINLRTKTR